MLEWISSTGAIQFHLVIISSSPTLNSHQTYRSILDSPHLFPMKSADIGEYIRYDYGKLPQIFPSSIELSIVFDLWMMMMMIMMMIMMIIEIVYIELSIDAHADRDLKNNTRYEKDLIP